MSGIALIWAANVKGLKPSTKIVLIQLADFHNKETGRCDPSASRLASECEMDRATVFRHMKKLEEFGLVERHSKGDGKGGRASNQYHLNLDVVLGPSSKHKEKSQIATRGKVANCDGGSGSVATGVVANCDTNLNKEPGREPHCDDDEVFFDEFWNCHPNPTDKPKTKEAFYDLLDAGEDPNRLIYSAKRYAIQQEDNKRRFIKTSPLWLVEGRWSDFELPSEQPSEFKPNMITVDRIKRGDRTAVQYWNPEIANKYIREGLLTKDHLVSVGFDL